MSGNGSWISNVTCGEPNDVQADALVQKCTRIHRERQVARLRRGGRHIGRRCRDYLDCIGTK